MAHQDLELVRRALAGEEPADRELARRIERVANRCLSDLSKRSAKIRAYDRDLLQRFQMMLLENDRRALRTYEGRASLDAWLQAVAARFFLRNVVKLAPKESSLDGQSLEEVRDPSESPEQLQLRRSTRAAIQRAVAELPDDDRLLIQLVYEQEAPPAEIGRALDLTPSGVRMRKHRLLRKLAELLKDLKS